MHLSNANHVTLANEALCFACEVTLNMQWHFHFPHHPRLTISREHSNNQAWCLCWHFREVGAGGIVNEHEPACSQTVRSQHLTHLAVLKFAVDLSAVLHVQPPKVALVHANSQWLRLKDQNVVWLHLELDRCKDAALQVDPGTPQPNIPVIFAREVPRMSAEDSFIASAFLVGGPVRHCGSTAPPCECWNEVNERPYLLVLHLHIGHLDFRSLDKQLWAWCLERRPELRLLRTSNPEPIG
mmetsp:Transcript_5657/g.13220  ORF Transcript_5657/g.13220 Transcript_5657/m.13220 type:complete len:240 (-) Transcript_5657:1247-1966(-)